MEEDNSQDTDLSQQRLERLGLRYRHAHFVFVGAKATLVSLREVAETNALEMSRALQRVQRAQEQLVDIRSAIEFLEDQQNVE